MKNDLFKNTPYLGIKWYNLINKRLTMNEQIKKQILEIIMQVPGIAGLSSSKLESGAEELGSHELSEAMSILETEKGMDVSIFVIISKGIKATIIANEIRSSVQELAKRNGVELKNVSVFIRGVK